MTNLTIASREWASRPVDERFTSLTSMHSFTTQSRRLSMARVLPNRALTVQPDTTDSEHKGLILASDKGTATMSHWAFGQLASRAGAPAGYLRTLPAPLAADALNYGLKVSRDVEEIGVLVRKGRDISTPTIQLAAVTGPNYGRIWNSDITGALVNRFGDGVTGDFRVPSEFGKVDEFQISKSNTTLYASDRDMFVFLADETNRVEVPNRRDGKSGMMARGFIVGNSEVGAGTLFYMDFLFDYACMNRIIWGASHVRTIKIRHTSGAPHRWIEQVIPAIEAQHNSGTASLQGIIASAKQKRVSDIDAFLATRFSGTQVTAIKQAHLADEGRPIETLWDMTTGITAYARQIPYQSERVQVEIEGGKVLQLAA